MICVVNYMSICLQTMEATLFNLKVIVIVSAWQVTYSGSCTNMNHTSDAPRQRKQVWQILSLHFIETLHLTLKQKSRSLSELQLELKTSFMLFLGLCCSPCWLFSVFSAVWKVGSMCAVLVVGTHPQLEFCALQDVPVCDAEAIGAVWLMRGVIQDRGSIKEVPAAGTGLPANACGILSC